MIQKITREEYEQKFGVKPFTPTSIAPEQPKTFGQKIEGVAKSITNFVGAKGISEQYGATIAKATLPKEQRQFVSEPTQKEVIGSAIQSGANLIPGVGKGLGLLAKVGTGLATGYAMDVGSKLQNNISQPLKPGIGTAVGGGLPVAGAIVRPAAKIVGRLFKGVGSGLSGVSTDTIDKIIQNPKLAQQATDKLRKTGNMGIIEENARKIVNGFGKIQEEASAAYGTGLEQLKMEDISPTTFRSSIQPILDKFGVMTEKGTKKLGNVEFTDRKNIKTATELINKLNKTKLDGVSLRKLVDDIKSAKYKVATSDERLSFNAFVNELSDSVKNAINSSTDKLSEINAKYTTDMQLSEAAQDIFGSTNFRNLSEVAKAANKLEGIFNEKGIDPKIIDDFLRRVGINPENFRTTEAVRQITNKTPRGLNAPGLSIGEITQTITGSIVTPQMIRDLSIATGMAKEKILPFLRGMNKTARNAVIQALLKGNEANSTQMPQ